MIHEVLLELVFYACTPVAVALRDVVFFYFLGFPSTAGNFPRIAHACLQHLRGLNSCELIEVRFDNLSKNQGGP